MGAASKERRPSGDHHTELDSAARLRGRWTPVEQPTKFELVVNMITAQALGLDVVAWTQLRRILRRAGRLSRSLTR